MKLLNLQKGTTPTIVSCLWRRARRAHHTLVARRAHRAHLVEMEVYDSRNASILRAIWAEVQLHYANNGLAPSPRQHQNSSMENCVNRKEHGTGTSDWYITDSLALCSHGFPCNQDRWIKQEK